MSLNVEQIKELIEQFEKETKAIRKEVIEICWHMRGGITFDEGMQLSFADRQIIVDIVKGHMETTNKSGLPFF